ncbi:MAG: hypothetical protein EOP92_33245, partial [Lysobacteraceae bacterium]|jgi:hypothetical protein
MGIATSPQRFAQLTEAVRLQGVERCLPYPDMTEVPEGYSRFAQEDAATHGLEWDDLCPAYALALLTQGGYRLPEDADAMEILWDELGGESTKLWSEVANVVPRAWRWLSLTRASRRAR